MGKVIGCLHRRYRTVEVKKRLTAHPWLHLHCTRTSACPG